MPQELGLPGHVIVRCKRRWRRWVPVSSRGGIPTGHVRRTAGMRAGGGGAVTAGVVDFEGGVSHGWNVS
jgi:hypothetical protein